jgi:ABC-2 type transport system permease protein
MTSFAASSTARQPRLDWLRVFWTVLARDARVLRRESVSLLIRSVMQPLMFTFVFSYLMPKIGMAGAPGDSGRGFSTVLVPGLLAITIALQGINAVTMPLLLELQYTKEIEDRALAPAPTWLLGAEKIVFGAFQASIGGLFVYPIVLFVHAKGHEPYVHVFNWPLFLVTVALSCLLSGATGLLLGTLIDMRKAQMFFAIVVTPLTMLGCVYYPWATLAPVRWLQILVLLNPVVYMSEGLRTSLTPQLDHMPVWAFLGVLSLGTLVVSTVAIRNFVQRVVG